MKITFKTFLLAGFVLGGAFYGSAQTKEQREKIIKNYDLKKLEELRVQFEKNHKENKAKAIELAKVNNWPLVIEENGNYSELMGVSKEGNPLYYITHNSGSALTSRVNRINSGGVEGLNLNGQGMIVGIFDGGPVRGTHQDLAGRVIYKDSQAFVSTSEGSNHGTHVAGTMIGSGATSGQAAAKGLAYQATLWGNTYDNDEAEAISEAAEGLLVSNHSYGLRIDMVPSYYMGSYIAESKEWDDIAFNAPYYLPVISAGNDRGSVQDVKGGQDLLIGNKNSKNVVVVAAVNQVTNYTSSASVVMSSFSSWGPTDDYRIKPDISTKGVAVYSLSSTADNAYMLNQGTSMAAPGVSASLLLMQQHYNNLNSSFMKSATLKALMVNSADEAGDYDGPDYKFGWGLINAQKAVQIITGRGTSSVIQELTLNQGQTYTRTLVSDGVKPLNVTVVWTDPSGVINTGTPDSTTPLLVNDLDVRLTKSGNTYYPWVLYPFFLQGGAVQDDNPYDNVENIDVPGASGTYTLTITHKGTLAGGLQNYSLVVDGVVENLGTEESLFNNFVVYPNPANDILNIQLDSKDAGDYNLSMYDVQGRIVKTFSLINNGALTSGSYDVSDLASGFYVLKVKQGILEESKKIIIK